jgi:hypothetical protein
MEEMRLINSPPNQPIPVAVASPVARVVRMPNGTFVEGSFAPPSSPSCVLVERPVVVARKGQQSLPLFAAMAAQGKKFDAAQEAERIADEKYQEARDLLTGMQRYETPAAVAPAAPLQPVQLHAIPEDIAAVE